jgi:hypothetical protein
MAEKKDKKYKHGEKKERKKCQIILLKEEMGKIEKGGL